LKIALATPPFLTPPLPHPSVLGKVIAVVLRVNLSFPNGEKRVDRRKMLETGSFP
jgi:hypothetical protein